MQSQPGMGTNRTGILLIAGAITLESLFIALLILQDWKQHILLFLTLYLASFVAYLFFAIQIFRKKWADIPFAGSLIFIAAFIFRLTIFWCEPSLSDDIYRYIWDGRVQNAGFNPYDYTPRAKQLEFLRNSDYEKINHKDFSTAYPPAAQNLFQFLTRISDSSRVFKFGILIFDFILIFLLKQLLALEQRPASYLLIYAWHPLPVIEFAGAGHMDIVAMCLMFLALYLLYRERPVLSGAALAAAVLTKYLPLISLPWLIRRGGWKVGAAMLAACLLLFWQYYTPDHRMFAGLFTFYRKWWFNDSLFRPLYHWLGGAEPARLVGGCAVLFSLGFCWIRKYPVYRSLLIVFGTILAFSPVVHPWYVCWVIPLLVFHSNPGWLFFSGWIAIVYVILYVYPLGKWSTEDWLRLLVYAPLYSLLLTGWIRGFLYRKKAKI